MISLTKINQNYLNWPSILTCDQSLLFLISSKNHHIISHVFGSSLHTWMISLLSRFLLNQKDRSSQNTKPLQLVVLLIICTSVIKFCFFMQFYRLRKNLSLELHLKQCSRKKPTNKSFNRTWWESMKWASLSKNAITTLKSNLLNFMIHMDQQ